MYLLHILAVNYCRRIMLAVILVSQSAVSGDQCNWNIDLMINMPFPPKWLLQCTIMLLKLLNLHFFFIHFAGFDHSQFKGINGALNIAHPWSWFQTLHKHLVPSSCHVCWWFNAHLCCFMVYLMVFLLFWCVLFDLHDVLFCYHLVDLVNIIQSDAWFGI